MPTIGSSEEARRAPIGVFDSGVGGLTVVRALRVSLPTEDIVYLGDTARVPYGSKSPRTVERYSLGCLQFLEERGIKLVLVACNTASANALPVLQEAARVPVIGAVEPGAQSALAISQARHIGVLGTLSTIRSQAYVAAIAARAPDAVVTGRACPLLVPLAEEGWTHGPVVELIARRYLEELLALDPAIDTIVLGCTHYPLLRDALAKVAGELAGRPIALVDSASAMAEAAGVALAAGLATPDRARGALDVFVTDQSRLDELAPRFLGEPLSSYSQIDL